MEVRICGEWWNVDVAFAGVVVTTRTHGADADVGVARGGYAL